MNKERDATIVIFCLRFSNWIDYLWTKRFRAQCEVIPNLVTILERITPVHKPINAIPPNPKGYRFLQVIEDAVASMKDPLVFSEAVAHAVLPVLDLPLHCSTEEVNRVFQDGLLPDQTLRVAQAIAELLPMTYEESMEMLGCEPLFDGDPEETDTEWDSIDEYLSFYWKAASDISVQHLKEDVVPQVKELLAQLNALLED